MATLHISVTQEDIDNGRRCHSGKCPIALAAARTGGDLEWSVGSRNAYAYRYTTVGAEIRTRHSLPKEARDFVRDFDFHQPVVPFEFDLETSEPEASE